jgi:hypothetical protein
MTHFWQHLTFKILCNSFPSHLPYPFRSARGTTKFKQSWSQEPSGPTHDNAAPAFELPLQDTHSQRINLSPECQFLLGVPPGKSETYPNIRGGFLL